MLQSKALHLAKCLTKMSFQQAGLEAYLSCSFFQQLVRVTAYNTCSRYAFWMMEHIAQIGEFSLRHEPGPISPCQWLEGFVWDLFWASFHLKSLLDPFISQWPPPIFSYIFLFFIFSLIFLTYTKKFNPVRWYWFCLQARLWWLQGPAFEPNILQESDTQGNISVKNSWMKGRATTHDEL